MEKEDLKKEEEEEEDVHPESGRPRSEEGSVSAIGRTDPGGDPSDVGPNHIGQRDG